MAAFSFVCRSIPKLLDGKTTGLNYPKHNFIIEFFIISCLFVKVLIYSQYTFQYKNSFGDFSNTCYSGSIMKTILIENLSFLYITPSCWDIVYSYLLSKYFNFSADFGLSRQKQPDTSKMTSVVGTILYSWYVLEFILLFHGTPFYRTLC